MEAYNIKFNPNLVVFGGFHEQNGSESMEILMELQNPPDAVFAVNDPVAIGAYETIQSYNLKVPDDVAVIGFSNNPVSVLVNPPLTTIEQPSYEMGRIAAGILIDELMDKNTKQNLRNEVIDTKLIIRDST